MKVEDKQREKRDKDSMNQVVVREECYTQPFEEGRQLMMFEDLLTSLAERHTY